MDELDRKISKVLSEWELPNGIDKNTAWQNILNTIQTDQKKLFFIKKWHWAAASIIILMLSSALFYTSIIEFESFNKEQLAINLPDGSIVNLNAASTLSYNKLLWYVNRNVTLKGEGYFKVKKGSQFIVSTKQGSVRVLGTEFNVFARKNNFNVACYKGSVEVKNNTNSIVIVKGEKTNNIINNTLIKSSLNKTSISPNWLNGVFVYSDALLADVINEIGRQYDVEFSSNESINSNTFTGEWNTKMPLEDVLEIVLLPFGLETNYKAPKLIEISSKTI